MTNVQRLLLLPVWGRVLKEEERFDEAVEAIQKSMNLFSFNAMQYGYLAEIERHRGNLPLAKSYLVKALNAYLHDTNPVMILLSAFICLALIYQQESKEQTALDLAAFVYHHQGVTAPQKEQLETIFGHLKNPSALASKPLKSLIIEQIEQLKKTSI